MRALAVAAVLAGVSGALVDPGAEVLPGPRVRLVEEDGEPAGSATPGTRGQQAVTAPSARASLPVPASLVDREDLAAPHHDYPASDLMVPEGTPVFAPGPGRVRRHRGERCGLGVTIVRAGFRWVLCHLSVVSVPARSRVVAGDVLGLSGDTGNARGVPHLHVHLRGPDGSYRCPQPLLVAWHEGRDRSPRGAPQRRWAGGPCWFAP